MNRAFLLFIFIQWYPFLLVKSSSSSSFFSFDKDRFDVPYYVNENFSIGATFNLPSSYKCSNSQCLTNLKLTLRTDDQLFMDLWCDSPAVLLIKKYGKMDELSCVLNGIDATLGSYQLSALVQVHMAGSFLPIFSAVFPNNPGVNQEWSNKEIIVLNSPMDTQQSMNLRTIKRNKRQDVNVDGANFRPTIVQADSVDNGIVDPMQTMPVNDEANAMNRPMQLNTYTGTANPGHTADLTCDGANSCPGYPKTDEQGRAICCFLLPQASDGITALSSIIYQNRTQNLNDFQVNIGDGQSFNAANDSSVFLGPVIAASQCKIILPPGTIESNSTQFRITWTYHSNSTNNNSSSPAATTSTDGTLPVNVLRVTSTSAFVQQRAQYNEWFVCPPSQDGHVSLLRSIALLAGNNVGYFRCIYVNKQGIPLKDPTNGQLLVFFSSKNGASDNPTITVLSAVHTDCISIQFFPKNGTSIDLNSILLSITIAFQTAVTTNMSSVLPQVSDLKGTSQIEIDITTDLSPNNDSNIDNNGQTSAQTLLPSEIDDSANVLSDQCTRYQPDIPMSYDISLGTYTGTFDIPSQNSQPTILDTVTVTASSTVENPITMLLVDSQGNTLSPSYSLASAATFQSGPKTSISKVILQATAMQDAAMDSTLHADIVVCPGNTKANGFAQSPYKSSIPSPQSVPSPSSVPSDEPLSCQERASSTYGTYPPDLLALTIPTKRPPKMLQPQSTIKPEIYATPSTPYQSLSVQTLPDHTCFDQIPFTNNPFLYDILISASDYTNSIDCLSPTSGCSLNFINAKQPKITLLFTTPACISYLRIPSPSNVQQFSYSMYDEDGTQMQLSGAIDNQGTLVSSLGADPIVQLNQSSCGYSIILQFLNTSDNGPAMRVTIDTGGCFKNLSTTTTTTPSVPSSMPPADGPSSWSQEIPSFVPARSKTQPLEFEPAPVFAPSPIVPLFPPLPSSPVAQLPSAFIQGASSSLSTSPWMAPPVPLYCANNYQLTTLSFENQCLSEILTSDPTVVPDYSLNVGNQGVNFQSNIPITITYQFSCIVYIKYICITGMLTNVNKFSYLILDSNQNNIGQGIVTRLTSEQCTPRPLPTAELASQVIITIEETTDGQPPRNIEIDMQACFLLSSVPSQPEYFQPEPFPLAPPSASIPLSPSPSETMQISPIQSFSPPSPFAPSPVLNPSPPLVSQKMLPSPISDPSPPPELAPSVTGISSPILHTSPSPPSYQAMLPSPIWSPPSVLSPSKPLQPPSPFPSQTIPGYSILSSPPSSSSSASPEVPFPSPPDSIQPPIMPAQQYSPPVVNPSSIYEVPPMPAPPQPLPSPIASNTITTQPLAPLVDANNGELMPLTFNSPCISQISTSDPSVLVDSNINPGAQGVHFQSNVPITITIQFSCNIQIAYICIPGSTTNVELFSYTLRDIHNNPVSSGFINPSGTDGCVPRSLDIASPVTQLIITILQTKDGQPPRNVILDLQGYYVSTVPSKPTQPSFIAVTPSAQDVAPVRPPFQIQPLMPLETAPMLVPVQLVFPAQQIHSAPSSQNPITPASTVSMDTCPEVSLTNHPGVELIVFSDGTTVTNDLNPDGDGCNLVSTGAIMTVILRNNMSATFSSIGVFSSNVNQIDVALFDEISNRPLIQSPRGTLRSSVTLNPSIQNLPDSPAGTLAVTFLSTIDWQPPRDVKLLVYACFPTITEILPSSPSTSPSMQPAQDPSQVSRTNMFKQQPDYPVNPSNQTYPNNQQYQYSSTGPTSVCIDPNQPAQVTSVANTPLPSSYYSSNQCVCICQAGVIIPTSSGVIQYYPPSRTINKRTIREKPSEKPSDYTFEYVACINPWSIVTQRKHWQFSNNYSLPTCQPHENHHHSCNRRGSLSTIYFNMYTRTRRKSRTESMEATAGERNADEEVVDDNTQVLKERQLHHHRDTSARDIPVTYSSLSSLAVPINDENYRHSHRSPPLRVVHLLAESDLPDLIQLDWTNQIRFFLNERSHLLHQLDFIRTQYERQYTSLKRRLDETETENERLTAQHRSESKELLLYKTLIEAPETSDSITKSKDYHQLKSTIDTVLKENERLYGEIHDFKTSDPVYEQVQLLETANKHLKEDLIQITHQNNRLKKLINIDEIKHLQSQLSKTNEEYEQLKVLNKKLINEIQTRQHHVQTPSPKQVRVYPHSPYSSTTLPRLTEENLSPLTPQNLRQFDLTSIYPLTIPSTSTDIDELKEHVHLLEQKLQQRDYELQTLQTEIEKGTSSIMSSIEDLYLASSSVSPSPSSNLALIQLKTHPTIEELQNELDQLHDKLDEIIRENQTLKNRTQEFDTIYEENEYLYAEKSQWNEELERARIRELVLEQQIYTLKEREKEFLSTNDSNIHTNSNTTQLKLNIDWLHRTNNQLELEIVRLREQMDLLTKKCQEMKKDLIYKDEHYKQLLTVAENKQQIPQELVRLEKIKIEMENQLNKERHEHERIVATLEEQSDIREQKYSSLYDTILKLQNDYRQKELDHAQQINENLKQRDALQTQFTSLQNDFQQIQQETKALKEEIKSKDEINRDLKLALTSSNNDTQAIYNQLRQLNTNLSDLQQKYDRDLAERDQQIDILQHEQKQLMTNYDGELLKTNQTIIQLQHENKQYSNLIETYRSNIEKLQIQLQEKQNFIDQVQNDLTERSTSHVNIHNQLSQENKLRMTKIIELESTLSQEQQRKIELQRTIQELHTELLKSRAITKESVEKSEELERRFHETDKHFEETIRTHLNETTEPTRRELTSLRAELVTKSDQVTFLQNAMDEEKLKRQRLEMKLKRLKDEYINVRKELYSRIEEINILQHELVECRFKNDYNLHITNQTFNSLKSPNETESSTVVELYLKEKTECQHWQLKCRTYQQKVEQLQKNYELAKEKYKQRLHEEREIFERTKNKYLDHIKNVQNDLQETRQLLEKDAELKVNQESAYQQLIDERRQLLTSMVDKDAKVREMRRENLLLTSKIQLLEDQMENLNERVDRTLRERNQLCRDINTVRFDSNFSIETSARSSPNPSSGKAITYIESTTWNPPVHLTESFGFNNGHHHETSPIS